VYTSNFTAMYFYVFSPEEKSKHPTQYVDLGFACFSFGYYLKMHTFTASFFLLPNINLYSGSGIKPSFSDSCLKFPYQSYSTSFLKYSDTYISMHTSSEPHPCFFSSKFLNVYQSL